MRFLTGVFCFMLVTASHAVNRNDFAYGYNLEVDGDGAIYSLYLNEEIYKGLVREDRSDLRVFNSQGMAVPHFLRRMENKQKQVATSVSPPFYPLYRSGNESNNIPPNVHITTNSQGAIIDINHGKVLPESRTVSGYIIDLSALEKRPDSLQITWPEDQADFVSVIKLESSDDLNHWRTLVNRATLSYLHYGPHTLVKNEVSLPSNSGKYLRLTWAAKEPLNITQLSAGFPDAYESQPRQWTEFGPSHYQPESSTYYFALRHRIPVDRLTVGLPIRNTLVRVNIESARSKEGPWYSRYRGLLYDLQQNGERILNPDITVPVTAHNYWRIEIMGGQNQLGGDPVLKLGWIPEQLLFVAQGESPFILAYGSGRVEAAQAPLSSLLTEKQIKNKRNLIKVAQLGSSIQLGDDSRLSPPTPPVDWKNYLLWAVLVLGVGILAYMALRLYRQMDQDASSE